MLSVIWFSFRLSCKEQGVGPDDHYRSLPTWDILWNDSMILNLTRTEWLLNIMGNQETQSIYTSREAGVISCDQWPVFPNCRCITNVSLVLHETRLMIPCLIHCNHDVFWAQDHIYFCCILTFSPWAAGFHMSSEWAQAHSAMALHGMACIGSSLALSLKFSCALEVISCICRNFPKRTLIAINIDGVPVSLHLCLTLEYGDIHTTPQ